MKRIDKIRNQRAFLENNNLQKEIYSKPKMTTLLLVIFLTMHQLLRDYEARNPNNQVGFLILMMIRNKGRKKKGRFLKVYFLQEKIRRIKIFSWIAVVKSKKKNNRKIIYRIRFFLQQINQNPNQISNTRKLMKKSLNFALRTSQQKILQNVIWEQFKLWNWKILINSWFFTGAWQRPSCGRGD